jgi:hypothetical protein
MTDPLIAFFASLPGLASAGAAIANASDAAQRNAQLIEFQKVVIQLQSSAASIQVQNSSLLRDKDALEKEIVRLKDWSAEREKYELKEVATGVFARVEKGYVGSMQSAHKLCCNCFEKAIPSTLQSNQISDPRLGHQVKLACPNGCPPVVFRHYL